MVHRNLSLVPRDCLQNRRRRIQSGKMVIKWKQRQQHNSSRIKSSSYYGDDDDHHHQDYYYYHHFTAIIQDSLHKLIPRVKNCLSMVDTVSRTPHSSVGLWSVVLGLGEIFQARYDLPLICVKGVIKSQTANRMKLSASTPLQR